MFTTMLYVYREIISRPVYKELLVKSSFFLTYKVPCYQGDTILSICRHVLCIKMYMSEVITLSVVLIISVLFSLDCELLFYTATFNMTNGLRHWELVMLYSFVGKLYYVLVHNNVLCIIFVMYNYVHVLDQSYLFCFMFTAQTIYYSLMVMILNYM